MKIAFTIFFILILGFSSSASPDTDSLMKELNRAITDAPVYDNNKLNDVTKLKKQLIESLRSDPAAQHDINLKLYEAYKYYNYDSALLYAHALQQLAAQSGDHSSLVGARLKAVFIMISGGMFKETFDSLNVISIAGVADSVKGEYYTLMGISYYNLADFNGDHHSTPFYNSKANVYLDSALQYYPAGTFEHVYYSSLKFLKKGEADSAIAYLAKLIERVDLSLHQVALATSTLGGIYLSQGREQDAKPYLIEASIADIKSSTKETLALLTLAGIIYKEGKIEEAVAFIEKANSDATFYDARLRKAQVGAILPLIEGAMISTIKTQKEKLQVFLIVLSVLVLLLAGFAVIIRNQVKKLKLARAGLYEANQKQQQINKELLEANEMKEQYNTRLIETNTRLVEANETKERYNRQLQEINNRLSEANRIKEEYIGYYFNMDTAFLARIDKLITALDKKLLDRKWDEARFILKSFDPKKEKDELLKNFDKVFLRLFPNFVKQFNTLFRDEEAIVLKDDQLLNAELRIFALIRLGVTENEKIAEILGYSINTIYAKKTKVRSKTIVNKDDFERRLVEITTLSL
jgi:DNA-binding CsgD family transcriptional regulator